MLNTEPYSKWRPHPWHGLEVGLDPPQIVHAYIEITPFDLVKYEVDKKSGYLRVDRPQGSSSLPPALYGFIPRTYCSSKVAAISSTAQHGDSDPLDICVISERPINRAEVVLNARVVGGIRMIDGDKADDKIIAVLQNDNMWSHIQRLKDIPEIMIERLRHYFSTYKLVTGSPPTTRIDGIYDNDHALKVVAAAIEDYNDNFTAETK